MPHNFNESMGREVAHFKKANQFYREHLSAKNIERCDFSTKEGKIQQRADIDLFFDHNSRRISVSEKKRNKDYGDIYLETYSKYPNTEGWVLHSKADFFAYFFPTRVFWAPFQPIVNFYRDHIAKSIPKTAYENIYKNGFKRSCINSIDININKQNYRIMIIQAYNYISGSSWHTIGFSMPFTVLENNDLDYQLIQY